MLSSKFNYGIDLECEALGTDKVGDVVEMVFKAVAESCWELL